jgi:plastocyanin
MPQFLRRFAFVCLTLACVPVHAEVFDMRLVNFRFEPNDITIRPGDTVRFINQQGFHDVRADDGSFARGAADAPWTFQRTFPNAGEVLVHCSVHSGPGGNINFSMNARIMVEAAAPTFAINQGIAGAWFEPATSGQGMLIDVEPVNRIMFVAWFTYVPPGTTAPKVGGGDSRWLVAQGNYTGANAPLTLFRVDGGRFDTPPTAAQTTTTAGTLTLDFTDCSNATANYVITEGNRTGSIPLQRVIPGTDALCRTLATPITAPETGIDDSGP